jgi:hypothetical protein
MRSVRLIGSPEGSRRQSRREQLLQEQQPRLGVGYLCVPRPAGSFKCISNTSQNDSECEHDDTTREWDHVSRQSRYHAILGDVLEDVVA